MRTEIRLCQTELMTAVREYVARKMKLPKGTELLVQIETKKDGPCGEYEVHTAVVEVGGLEVDDAS